MLAYRSQINRSASQIASRVDVNRSAYCKSFASRFIVLARHLFSKYGIACQIWKSSRFTFKTLSINLLSTSVKLFLLFLFFVNEQLMKTNINYF